MYRFKISDLVVGLVTGMMIGFLPVALGGCEQVKPSQRPSDGPRSAVQASPWVDPACYVEGALVALECNEPGTWPSCPAEDEAHHAGQPCFWHDPDGRGLLWSDGIADR